MNIEDYINVEKEVKINIVRLCKEYLEFDTSGIKPKDSLFVELEQCLVKTGLTHINSMNILKILIELNAIKFVVESVNESVT